jgi:hypothetical protein
MGSARAPPIARKAGVASPISPASQFEIAAS